MTLASMMLVALLSSAQAESCAARDRFCVELKHAQFLEARWRRLDHALEAFAGSWDGCARGFSDSLRQARTAANEKFLAYAVYYRKWAEFARDQSQLFVTMAAQRKAWGQETDSLLASAEREYADLTARRDALQKAGGISSVDEIRTLNSLIAISAQRMENFMKARSKWQEGEASSDFGRKAAMNLGAQILDFSRLSESERILMDAYYEGRELRLQIMCHGQSH